MMSGSDVGLWASTVSSAPPPVAPTFRVPPLRRGALSPCVDGWPPLSSLPPQAASSPLALTARLPARPPRITCRRVSSSSSQTIRSPSSNAAPAVIYRRTGRGAQGVRCADAAPEPAADHGRPARGPVAAGLRARRGQGAAPRRAGRPIDRVRERLLPLAAVRAVARRAAHRTAAVGDRRVRQRGRDARL